MTLSSTTRLLGLILSLLALSARAAVHPAATASRADVATAIGLCSDGDEVTIPAGNVTYSSAITVTVNIFIVGAGTNDSGGTVIAGPAFIIAPTTDKTNRICQIQFKQADWSTSYIIIVQNLSKQNRIDHCLFYKGTHTVNFGFGGSNMAGDTFGVVDHNVFFDCNTAVYVQNNQTGDGAVDGSVSFAHGFVNQWAPGTTNTVVIEDNLFLTDSQITSAANNNNEMIYTWGGARTAFRFNTMWSQGGEPLIQDYHGFIPGTEAGTALGEFYNNTMTNNPFAFGYMFIRGGRGLWFSNTVTSTSSSLSTMIQINNEEVAGSTALPNCVTNYYFWSNVLNGVLWTGPLTERSSPYNATAGYNVAYFMAAPQSGQGFFPYTPLIHPSPTVTAEDGGGGPDPSITVQPTSQTVTAPATATFSVTATGNTALSYQWNWFGTNVTGATSSTWTTPATTTGMTGSSVYVTVSDTAGSLQSTTVTLTVFGGGGGITGQAGITFGGTVGGTGRIGQ